jgi:hypothetical protein
MRHRTCRPLAVLALALVLAGFAAPPFAGRPLEEVLLEIGAQGPRLIFTSELVPPGLRVEEEPQGASWREIVEEILAPHGLRLEEVSPGVFVVLRAPSAGGRPVEAAAAAPGERLSTPSLLEEIVVTPSRISLLAAEPAASLAFSAEEIAALPHLGDDLFRTFTLLPGISGNELSARFHVRGGRSDEVMVLLDQLELFEPFHLRDFSDALSVVAPQAIAEVDLFLGGFPASYGDRMGGVLEMRSARAAAGRPLSHLGLSVLNAQLGSSGHFAAGRGSWLGVARYGSLDAVRRHLSAEERPRYWDAFVKADYAPGPAQEVGFRLLRAEDRLKFAITERGDFEQAETFYRNSYLWLTHRATLGRSLLADTVFSLGRVDRDRRTREQEGDDEGFSLRDERRHEFIGLRQDWSHESERGEIGQLFSWGLDSRHYSSLYDYENERELEDPLAEIRSEPRSGTRRFRRRPKGDFFGVYLSQKVRLHPRLTTELGLRWDEQELAGDTQWSPRLHAVYALTERDVLRFSWGHYFQSHRPYELRVEDGETEFLPSEQTEQFVFAYERSFRHGWQLRCDLYSREVRNPRPRFENIFEPISSFPEIEPDRVRFAPESSSARGLEIFLRGRFSERVGFWLSTTHARSEDRLAGRDMPRAIDQPHNLSFDLAWRASEHWTVNLAWRWHSGWPTTALSAVLEEDEDGELEPRLVFGPIFGERLPEYHRLDLRASRSWQARRGRLTFFLDLQNLYDRENIAGFNTEFGFEPLPDGQVRVVPVEEKWGGFLPSFGIDWRF